jgi:hypothetical protein
VEDRWERLIHGLGMIGDAYEAQVLERVIERFYKV